MNARIKAVVRRCALSGGLCMGIIVLSAQLAETQFPPVELISVRFNGGQANANSSGGVTSADGRCVAYYTNASDILPQGAGSDSNGLTDVYLYYRDTQQVQRVSVGIDGRQPDGPSMAQGFRPSIDPDCTCVGFSSDATNLVPDDANDVTDVFVRLVTDPQATVLASVGMGGELADGASSFTSLSAGCELMAFQSVASNLVPGDTNGTADIFVYDLATGTTTRESVGVGGEQANGPSITPSISADGRCVAFASSATNLWSDDTNGVNDIYVACDGEVICRASVGSGGEEGYGMSLLPALSADGTVVAFKSEARLVEDDLNGMPDVYWHDCSSGETVRVSVSSEGEEGNDISIPPTISGDGRLVAFGSFASNLLLGQSTNARSQVYVHDLDDGTTSLISSNMQGGAGNGSVPDLPPSISLDGNWVAFESLATDLVPADTNGFQDVFMRAVGTLTPTPTPTSTVTPTNTPIPCAFDTDCPLGFECKNEECQPKPTPTPPTPCNDDDDCDPPLICVNRECKDPSTPTPTATPLPTCTEDEDCLPGFVCRAGVCVPRRECENQLECRGERETCLDGSCECGGDCNLNGIVFGTEISRMMCIIGGVCPLSECPAGDIDRSGEVTARDVSLAVLNLGLGCPGEGTPLIFIEDRATEVREIVIGDLRGSPGEFVDVDISVAGGDDVTTVQVDILFDTSLLSVQDPQTLAPRCQIAERLAGTFFPEIRLPQVLPPDPLGQRRLRIAVVDINLPFPLDSYGPGPIATCRFRIDPTARPGTVSAFGFDPERVEVGDPNAAMFQAEVSAGSITVTDPQDCPCPPDSGLHCRDDKCLPIVPCSSSSECQLRQTCLNGVCECLVDCNTNGKVIGNDINNAILILGGLRELNLCPAASVNGRNVIGNDINNGILNLGFGCPLPWD